MNFSRKLVLKNPRNGANKLSQLFFLWTIPTMFRGCFHSLNEENLWECLKKDRSQELGDKLEMQWQHELTESRNKKKEPRLRNAILRTFWKNCIADGFLVLFFTILKSILPVFLAQLLVQFQSSSNSDSRIKSFDFKANQSAVVDENFILNFLW
ncbi:CLUMA_CG003617, isoform A [Clunio marinus]|uniref:CLUMA_CG003617, isoform A n=1 Tax=Clunio marinus TaxID=568069 RepID=A0A1J1HNZ2_9DIPT|nr:CLUMA_CG003617, isoform A [Clunio marinus]